MALARISKSHDQLYSISRNSPMIQNYDAEHEAASRFGELAILHNHGDQRPIRFKKQRLSLTPQAEINDEISDRGTGDYPVAPVMHVWSSLEIEDSTARVCWKRDAEASASSDASASCYRRPEDIGILPVVVAELKLIQISGRYFLLTLW
jgi:hypothetical protein